MKAAKDTITINGAEYKVRNSIRAIFIFEQITDKAFSIKSSLDNFVFLYSVILASNPGTPLTWDEFIDAVDADRGIVDGINEIIAKGEEVEKLLSGSEDMEEGEDGKKKA